MLSLFNKNSFIPEVNPKDLTVRLVDVDGHVRFLIKEPDATITLEGKRVLVRQRADTNMIELDFASPRDAREAMTTLQQALSKIRANKPTPTGGGGGVPDKYYILPSYDGQTGFNLSFQPKTVDGVYVNGQLIDNMAGSDYSVVDGVFNWLSGTFDLETTDVVLLEYYGILGGTPPPQFMLPTFV